MQNQFLIKGELFNHLKNQVPPLTVRGKIPNQIKRTVKHDALFSQSPREFEKSHPPP